VAFNTLTGAVLSARNYSSNSHNNYNKLVKSMVISSGDSPIAYILSNDRNTPWHCFGQHLFKFNPKSFDNHPPAWIKKTINELESNCGHLGLTFGRDESVLYAFSFYNGSSTVSLLNTNLIS
jgi:hypothetical protein